MKIQLPEEKDLTKEKKKQSPSATYIQLMLETEKELYTDCEAIMYGITVACLKFGVESEIECLFSQFEAKVGPRRNAKEDTMSDEFEITVNGPSLPQADRILETALEARFKDKREGFITKTNIFTNMKTSKPVQRLKKEPSKFPFM